MNWIQPLEAALLGIPIGLALGLVGGGGSILTVPLLVGVLGMSPHLATGTSLVVVAANASSALRSYLREHLVQIRVAVLLVISGLPGTALGTAFNHLIDARALTLGFALLMVVAAVRMWQGQRGTALECPELQLKVPPLRLAAIGILIGFTTGFFGVGGGFVVVPALAFIGLCTRQAIPTSLLVIVLNSLIALGMRMLFSTEVPLEAALPLTLALILGGMVGAGLAPVLARHIGSVGLSKMFAGTVLALACYLAFTVVIPTSLPDTLVRAKC